MSFLPARCLSTAQKTDTLFGSLHMLITDTGVSAEGGGDMRRRKCSDGGTGVGFIAFGAGLLVCTLLPSKLLMIVLGAVLILCGCTCGKR